VRKKLLIQSLISWQCRLSAWVEWWVWSLVVMQGGVGSYQLASKL